MQNTRPKTKKIAKIHTCCLQRILMSYIKLQIPLPVYPQAVNSNKKLYYCILNSCPLTITENVNYLIT